jgi:hypothetical protein
VAGHVRGMRTLYTEPIASNLSALSIYRDCQKPEVLHAKGQFKHNSKQFTRQESVWRTPPRYQSEAYIDGFEAMGALRRANTPSRDLTGQFRVNTRSDVWAQCVPAVPSIRSSKARLSTSPSSKETSCPTLRIYRNSLQHGISARYFRQIAETKKTAKVPIA